MTTVSEHIIDAISANGVERVWGVVGDALNPIVDAIAQNPRVSWHGVHHEETAAFAAGAESQLTGNIAVCAGTVGPGALHLVNGLADAWASRTPVLAVTGQVPRAEIGTRFHQEIDLDSVFRPVTVYNHTLTDPEQAPTIVSNAIRAALGRRGPAVVSVPADVAQADISEFQATIDGPFLPAILQPHPDAIARAIKLLQSADTVTILAGIGAAHARDDVIELADRLGAPIVSALRGKPAYEFDNPFYVGLTGLIGNGAAADAVRSADVLIMIGTDFPYREWLSDGQDVIQIDVDPAAIGRRTRVAVPIHGDAQLCARLICDGVAPRPHTDHLESAQAGWSRWLERQSNLAEGEGVLGMAYATYLELSDGRLHPELVAQTLGELAQDDAIFTADVGLSTVWAARFVHTSPAQHLIGSMNHGSMANALPQALGAQAAQPDRQVISMSGDGGLMMLLGDLRTAVSLGLPVKVVVFNNESLGLVELEEAEMGIPPTSTGVDSPSFADVGASLGLKGYTITSDEELRPVLAAALADPGPVIVDVHTSRNAISVPPSPTLTQAWGFARAKARELLS